MSELQVDFKDQINQFLLSVLLGAVLALVYDLIKSVRLSFIRSKWTVFVLDVAFFTLSAFATYIFLLGYCKGELRFYVITGEVVGFTFYRILLSEYVLVVFKFITDSFIKILSPVGKIMLKCVKLLKTGAYKVYNKAKKYLKCIYTSLYNLRNCKKKEGVKNGQPEGQYIA